MKEVINL